MKLHILSDLHIEFGDFKVPETDADVVILAGDIHLGDRGLTWILEQGFRTPVIYIPGNHEFYRYKFPGLIDELRRKSEGTNVHFLENDAVMIDGFNFFGCTLWSDMELLGNPASAMSAAENRMNDYQLIRNSKTTQVLTPGETVTHHKQSVKKLKEFIETGNPEKSIVITHSTPSIQSIPERFQGHPLTPAFASNLEDFILNHEPCLWIHGHTHDSFDYHIGKTGIICNPRGYVPDALNPDFQPNLTITI